MAYIIIGVAVLGCVILLSIVIKIYNNLVTVKNNVDAAWKNIDVFLRQRHDELPKLVDVCRGYMQHEKSVLENIVKLRSAYQEAGGMEEKARIENEISRTLSGLRVVFENYPTLKANDNFIKIMERVSALESKIAAQRENFNDNVNIYNIQIEKFPDFIVAGRMNYEKHAFLEVPEDMKEDVKIKI